MQSCVSRVAQNSGKLAGLEHDALRRVLVQCSASHTISRDLTTFESPCTEVWIDSVDVATFATRVAREMLDAVPGLTNKGMCVGIYNQQGEAISYLPLGTIH